MRILPRATLRAGISGVPVGHTFTECKKRAAPAAFDHRLLFVMSFVWPVTAGGEKSCLPHAVGMAGPEKQKARRKAGFFDS
jgi:hypothetical protein